MPSSTVVIAQNDPTTAMEVANDLHAHFASIFVASNTLQLHTLLKRHTARMAVLDLELVGVDEVRQLARIFDDLTIVCTHRSPDERMWMAALGAGAVELCLPHDIRSILRASRTAAKHAFAIAA